MLHFNYENYITLAELLFSRPLITRATNLFTFAISSNDVDSIEFSTEEK